MSQINSYVNEVLDHIDADKSMKMRIKSDLTLQLNDAAQSENIEDVLQRMGDPKDVAKEFMDSIYEGKGGYHPSFTGSRSYHTFFAERIYEYKSKASLFGIPLVHIKMSRYGKPTVAKGIIAIGTFSIGVISIGAIPVGIISIGGIALGVVSFGGMALGLLLAIGGIALGTLAVGGMTVGLGAIGGLAVGKIAFGGYAVGTVAIGYKTAGEYGLFVQHTGPETRAAVESLIRSAFPNLPDWIVNIFSSIQSNFRSN